MPPKMHLPQLLSSRRGSTFRASTQGGPGMQERPAPAPSPGRGDTHRIELFADGAPELDGDDTRPRRAQSGGAGRRPARAERHGAARGCLVRRRHPLLGGRGRRAESRTRRRGHSDRRHQERGHHLGGPARRGELHAGTEWGLLSDPAGLHGRRHKRCITARERGRRDNPGRGRDVVSRRSASERG